MEKGKGTTIGAVLLGALLLRPGGVVTATAHNEPASETGLASSGAKEAMGEGPWTASCKYWASSRTLPAQAKPEKSAEFSVDFTRNGKKVQSRITASQDNEDPCPGATNAWGIVPMDDKPTLAKKAHAPKLRSTVTPDITAIVAAVPDPLHAHMALPFDRTIDALLQAAADNNYVSSNYWIPWEKSPRKDAKESSGSLTAEERERERQPGLIVLKYVPNHNLDSIQAGFARKSYEKVIYLFLVRNSPVVGMDGEELSRAFKYEQQLRSLRSDVKFSTKADGKCPASASNVPNKAASGQPQAHSKAAGASHTRAKAPLSRPDPECLELAVIGSTSTGSAASLRQGIRVAVRSMPAIGAVRIGGGSSTEFSEKVLSTALNAEDESNLPPGKPLSSKANIKNPKSAGNEPVHNIVPKYISFGDDAELGNKKLALNLSGAGYDPKRVAFLLEDGTTSVETAKDHLEHYHDPKEAKPKEEQESPAESFLDQSFKFRFPRGISLLRNAHRQQPAEDDSTTSTPYLHLSLQDSSIDDSVPRFSDAHSPLSQEAELSSIIRRMRQMRTQIAVISSTNVLDEIFLSKFLHQVLPDLRIVTIGGGDLLYEREIDNVSFVGGVTITPYNLSVPVPSGNPQWDRTSRSFSDGNAERLYNAASYIFWDGKDNLSLANYRSIFNPQGPMHASMWATLVGRDGYYPLGIMSECASSHADILPSFVQQRGTLVDQLCTSDTASAGKAPPPGLPSTPPVSWYAVCLIVCCLCGLHIGGLLTANLWSPLTRDLAIDTNDEPRRRSVYIHIGTTMLFCMAWVVAYPMLPVMSFTRPLASSLIVAVLTVIAGVSAFAISLARTGRYWFPSWTGTLAICKKRRFRDLKDKMDLYRQFHCVAAVSMLLIFCLWAWNCGVGLQANNRNWFNESVSHEKLFFSYRCLNLFSGVSPALPVLLLLFGWYLWAYFQTRRMRFSQASRPKLPGKTGDWSKDYLFISDREMDSSNCDVKSPLNDAELVSNITCLLITRELVLRHFKKIALFKPGNALLILYLFLMLLFATLLHIDSPERIFWNTGSDWQSTLHRFLPTTYELLVEGLFLPLMLIAFTGWIRMMLIWSSLSGGLLRPLERRPIRLSFNRLEGLGWMAVMRQNGFIQRQREMARSTESMRQLIQDNDKTHLFEQEWPSAAAHQHYDILMKNVHDLQRLTRQRETALPTSETTEAKAVAAEDFRCLGDVPFPENQKRLCLMHRIEASYGAFGTMLIECVLFEYWNSERKELVAGRAADPGESLAEPEEKNRGRSKVSIEMLAEEFLAIRYLSLIRAVLVNVRELMTFILCAFVISIVSWNSYPFRPREWVDAALTGLLLILGTGVVWVLAQIHRDPILSRITRTRPNELGWEFYLRVITFGAIPVLTWLAYQFPSISSTILRYVQPSIEAVK